MAYKQPGNLDFTKGGMGYFLTYCPDCKEKIILKREEASELISHFHWAIKRKETAKRRLARKILTSLLERV